MKKESSNFKLSHIKLFTFSMLMIWLLFPFALLLFYEMPSKSSELGDTYGILNSLFSGVTLIGLIYTIYLQRQAFNVQREELDTTKIELNLTRDEFKIQNATLRLQRFENTFFNLLGLHHQIVNGIDAPSSKPGEKNLGRDAFVSRYNYLLTQLNSSRTKKTSFEVVYLDFWKNVQSDFGHYFRNMYRIVKLIDETVFYTHEELGGIDVKNRTPKDDFKYEAENQMIRYRYTSILRSKLSDYELLWLFYNCLCDNGIEKFKPLIEKYSMLKNTPLEKLHDFNTHEYYDSKAFGWGKK